MTYKLIVISTTQNNKTILHFWLQNGSNQGAQNLLPKNCTVGQLGNIDILGGGICILRAILFGIVLRVTDYIVVPPNHKLQNAPNKKSKSLIVKIL